MPKMRDVHVYRNNTASVSDVMQLILRLPYSEAVDLAEATQGDVDNIIAGAKAWAEANAETDDDD